MSVLRAVLGVKDENMQRRMIRKEEKRDKRANASTGFECEEGVSDGTSVNGVTIEHAGGDDCQSRSTLTTCARRRLKERERRPLVALVLGPETRLPNVRIQRAVASVARSECRPRASLTAHHHRRRRRRHRTTTAVTDSIRTRRASRRTRHEVVGHAAGSRRAVPCGRC